MTIGDKVALVLGLLAVVAAGAAVVAWRRHVARVNRREMDRVKGDVARVEDDAEREARDMDKDEAWDTFNDNHPSGG